jgi:hypothetical protein
LPVPWSSGSAAPPRDSPSKHFFKIDALNSMNTAEGPSYYIQFRRLP